MTFTSSAFLATIGGAAVLVGVVGLLVLRRLTGAHGFRILAKPAAVVVVASDTGAGVPATVRDPHLGLRGRPDYLLEERNGNRRLIPIELKPNRRSSRLYESDRIQLAAYLVALGGSLPDRAAPFGVVRYASGTFRVELTRELAGRVESIVSAIRSGREKAVVHRSHSNPALCARCALRQACDEALA